MGWFVERQRDLPWRRNTDPYSILVSEIMLQQTQVETVIPYYLRFMEAFPDFETLASAEEEKVLGLWAGLGYYRRAKNLRACARAVLERHQGVFPSDKESILDLPGVGPYTAGAIMSIALDQPEPLVDGNVERVLTRVFAVEEDLGRAEGKKKIWSLADELVPQKRPGCFNQALMELGATICKSSTPLCSECVLISDCLAHRQGRTRDFPVKSRSRKRSKVKELLLAMESDGKWLVVDSNEEGIYSGLWQFPWVWIHPASKDKIGLERLCRQFGVSNADLAPVWETRHAVTYRDINTLCFVLRMPSDFSLTLQEPPIHRWLELKTLESSPLPAYQKNFLRFLRGESP